jgi:hypothetical protein
LPGEFVALSNQLSLAQKTWQLFGISHRELMDMSVEDQEMIKIMVALNG